MDGAERAFAAPGLIELGAEEYRCWPFTIGNWAEIGMMLICERPSAAALARRAAAQFRDVGLEGNLINLGIAQTRGDLYVTHAQAHEYRDSLDGLAFRLWCQIRGNDERALTRQTVRKLFWDQYDRLIATAGSDGGQEAAATWADRLRERLVVISAEDDRANLDWPPASGLSRQIEMAMRSRGEYVPIPWRRILRQLAEAYSFRPKDVAEMTLYQVKVFTSDEEHLGPGLFWRRGGGAPASSGMGATAAARREVRRLGRG